MPEVEQVLGRDMHLLAHICERRAGVLPGAGIRWRTVQSVIAAILRHHDARACLPGDDGGPWNDPSRQIGVAVKCEEHGAAWRTFANDICEQINAVVRTVPNLTSGNVGRRNTPWRLKHDALLKAPQDEQHQDVERGE